MRDNGFTKWVNGDETHTPKNLCVCDKEKITNFVAQLWDKSTDFALESDEQSQTFTVRKTLDLHTLADGEDGAKLEHLWERLLTASHPSIYNQFSLRGTNNIDMIKVGRNNTITALFELKTGNTNNLFHAAYEITFYYFVLLNAVSQNKKLTDEKGHIYRLKKSGMDLIITAPKKWFSKRGQPSPADSAKFLSLLQTAVAQKLTEKTTAKTPVTFKILALPQQSEKKMRKIVSAYEQLKRKFKEIPL